MDLSKPPRIGDQNAPTDIVALVSAALQLRYGRSTGSVTVDWRKEAQALISVLQIGGVELRDIYNVQAA